MQQQGSIVRWDGARGFGFIRSARTQAEVFFHVRDFGGAPEPALRMAVDYEEIHVGGKGPRAMAVRPQGAAPALAVGHNHNNLRQRRGSAQGGQSHAMGMHPARQSGKQNSQHSGNGGNGSNSSNARTSNAGHRTASKDRSARSAAPGSSRGSSRGSSPATTGQAVFLLLLAGWLGLMGWGAWSGRLPLWTAGALLALNLLTVWSYAADKNAARAGTWRVSEKQLHLLSLLGGWPAAWLAQQNLRHKTSKAPFRAVYWLTTVVHCAALGLWLWRGPEILSL